MGASLQACLLLFFSLLAAAAPRSHINGNALLRSASEPAGERRLRADDLTLDDLKILLDRQAQTVDLLQSQLQAEKNHVSSLEGSVNSLTQLVAQLKSGNDDLTSQLQSLSGRLTASSKAVGFSVRFNHDGGQYVGIPLGQHSTLVFDNVLDNIGNAYDPHTGIFTAPVSGLYSFFLTQMTADNQPHLWLSIMRDGQSLDRIYTEGGQGDTHDQGASQVVSHLQAGQKVWVRQEEGGAVRGSWFTVFTGYLIQAD